MNIAEWSADFPVIGAYKIHPICALVPDMDQEQFARFRKRMAARGFDPNRPILTFRGIVVNGRQRLRAAIAENVQPFTREWRPQSTNLTMIEEEIKDLVIGEDIDRRHMTAIERAAAVAEIRKFRSAPGRPAKGETPSNEGISVAEGARQAGTSVATMERGLSVVKTFEKTCKAIREAVKAGEFTKVDASNLAGLEPGEQKRILKHARDNGCKLAAAMRDLHARNHEIKGASVKTAMRLARMEFWLPAEADHLAVDSAKRMANDLLDRRGIDPAKYPPRVTGVGLKVGGIKTLVQCVRCDCLIYSPVKYRETEKGPVCERECADGKTESRA